MWVGMEGGGRGMRSRYEASRRMFSASLAGADATAPFPAERRGPRGGGAGRVTAEEERAMVYWLNSLHLPSCLLVQGVRELRDGVALAELARCLAEVREGHGGAAGAPLGFEPTAAQIPLKAVDPGRVPRVGYAAVAGRLVAALRPLQGVGGVPAADQLPDLCVGVAKGDAQCTLHLLRCLRRIHQVLEQPLHPDRLWAGYLTPPAKVRAAQEEGGGGVARDAGDAPHTQEPPTSRQLAFEGVVDEAEEDLAGKGVEDEVKGGVGEAGDGGEAEAEAEVEAEADRKVEEEESARERLAWREQERERRSLGQAGVPDSVGEAEISEALAYVRAAREARPSSRQESTALATAAEERAEEAAEREWEARLNAYLRRTGRVLACKRVRDPLEGFGRHEVVNLLEERVRTPPRRQAWHVDPRAPERESFHLIRAPQTSARRLEGLVQPDDLEAQGVRVISTPLRKRVPPPGARALVVTADLAKVLDRLHHAMHGRTSYKRFADVFGGVDSDHDGKLTRWELRMAVAQRLGVVLKNAQLEPLAKAIEDGPDGFLSLAGLYRIAAAYKPHWT